jgi:hypothetical protein
MNSQMNDVTGDVASVVFFSQTRVTLSVALRPAGQASPNQTAAVQTCTLSAAPTGRKPLTPQKTFRAVRRPTYVGGSEGHQQ